MKRTAAGIALTELIMETFRLNGKLLEEGNNLTAPLGLTSARWQVLGAIEAEKRPMTVAQIARHMGLTRQAVQRIANELEKLNFITFERNPDHKRAKLVALTDFSKRCLQALDQRQIEWVNALADNIPEVEVKQASALLSKIGARCSS